MEFHTTNLTAKNSRMDQIQFLPIVSTEDLKMKKRLMALNVLAIFLFAFLGCSQNDGQEAASKKDKVRLSTSKNVWCSLPLIAINRGFFELEGLDVEVAFTDGGRYCTDAIISNSADLGTIVETNVAYLGYTGNSDVLVIGNVVKSTGLAIVARKSSGISKIDDLKGKNLGFVPAMQGEIFAHRLLKKNGIGLDEINFRKMQPKAIASALGSGSIDAAATWEPFVYACKRALGDDAVAFEDPTVHTGYMHLAARADWAEENPEVVSSFLRALKRAEKFVAAKPQEAKLILAKEMNVDLEVVEGTWPSFEIALTFDAEEIAEAITDEGAWVAESQESYNGKEVPDYSGYVSDKFYLEAFRTGASQPEAVGAGN